VPLESLPTQKSLLLIQSKSVVISQFFRACETNTCSRYFLHVDNLCYYLTAQLFQEKAEQTITQLHLSSDKAVATLTTLDISAQQVNKQVYV
jgi:hypothetical protein